MYQPLADILRPQSLSEVYGQDHILGEGAILRRLIDSGKIPNMIFYGPSGTGKTTVANIIAKQTNRTLFKLNATTASTADIKEIVAQLDTQLSGKNIVKLLTGVGRKLDRQIFVLIRSRHTQRVSGSVFDLRSQVLV